MVHVIHDNSHAAEPPGGGRQDHEAMRAAAMHPVSGPASTDTLAASGGLQVPGREPHLVHDPATPSVREPIPGERDSTTLTHREPGAMGGQFAGADIPPSSQAGLSEAEAYDRALEGGGEVATAHRPKGHPAQ